MGLYGDKKELLAVWPKLGLLGKLIYGSALIGAVLSVGSLADSVFEFKGFVIYGIEFYQKFSEPFINLISKYIHVELSREEFDLLVIPLVASIGLVRSNISVFSEHLRQTSERAAKRMEAHRTDYSQPQRTLIQRIRMFYTKISQALIVSAIPVVLILLPSFFVVYISMQLRVRYDDTILFARTILLFAAIWPLIFIALGRILSKVDAYGPIPEKENKVSTRRGSHLAIKYNREHTLKDAFTRTGTFLIGVYFLVAVIAAVSEGLTRPLSS